MAKRVDAAIIHSVVEAMNTGGEISPALVGQLDELFAGQQSRLFGLCLRMVHNAEHAQELTQDTMLTAYRNLHKFRGDSSFSTWLYSIARNLCLNAIRRRGELLSNDGVIEVNAPGLSALSQLRQHEREALITAAAQAVLSPIEQEAVHLRYVEGLPQDTITDVLDIEDKSGARGVLQRCRRKLQRELRERLVLLGHGSSFVRGTIA